jgi:hypothetical protein
MKNFVTFDANFQDDSEWSETGDPIVPRGRAVVGAIASGMSSQTLCCSNPEQRSFYGWAFHVEVGARFQCVVQYVEPWLLICDRVPTIADRLFGRKHESDHRRVLEALGVALTRDPRFSSVKWFTREEFESSAEARGERVR